jgi:hypothetical protein
LAKSNRHIPAAKQNPMSQSSCSTAGLSLDSSLGGFFGLCDLAFGI